MSRRRVLYLVTKVVFLPYFAFRKLMFWDVEESPEEEKELEKELKEKFQPLVDYMKTETKNSLQDGEPFFSFSKTSSHLLFSYDIDEIGHISMCRCCRLVRLYCQHRANDRLVI